MSADFWAGYLSGAAGVIIGNPLDLIKTRIQAGQLGAPRTDASLTHATTAQSFRSQFNRVGTLARGAAAPALGYGALNALLYMTYNRSLAIMMGQKYLPPPDAADQAPDYAKIWMAGAIAGFATFIVSAPTELIKCRAQVSTTASSWSVARDIWRTGGIRGLYAGGGVTSIRDAGGYGFYYWSYEWSKRLMAPATDSFRDKALQTILCGGFAGVVTWASVFPLGKCRHLPKDVRPLIFLIDVIKTRVQTQSMAPAARTESSPLLGGTTQQTVTRRTAREVARELYAREGVSVFFRGLGVCSVRAFIVNAVQWSVYEWMMQIASHA